MTTLKALVHGKGGEIEGTAIRSWADECPREGRISSTPPPASGVVGPDDTIEDPDAARIARRRASGPRKRVTLTADDVRDALEQKYRDEESWEKLVELYLGRIESADAREKVELLAELADVLWHEMDDAEQAQDALVEALAIDPGDEEIARRLSEIARTRTDGWTALAVAVEAKLDGAGPREKLELAERLVRWSTDELCDKRRAEKFCAVVRSLDPGNPLVHRRLAGVYREVGAWDAQRESLERALARAHTDEDRCAIHVALGELLERRLGDSKRAIHHYESAYDLGVHTMPALAGLERIFRTKEQWTRLADVLDRQVDVATTNDVRLGALLRLGALIEHHYLKPREAAPKYEVALALDPSNVAALDGLERCWHALREWEKLATTLDRRARAEADPKRAIAALVRLAEVREAKLGDPAGSLAAWRRVYEIDTRHRQAIGELARLSEKERDFTAAAAYRARIADLTDDAREKARIHVAVGEMLAPADRDPAAARIHFERAVELSPKIVGAWEHLQKIAERDGDAMYAAFCLERRAENTESPRLKAQLLVELAKTRASLGDSRGALATYEYAFATDATNETAARAVLGEWVRRAKWDDAAGACDVLVAAATRDGDERALVKLLRLSTRIALALSNGDRALLAACAALDLAPNDAGARDDVLHVCHELRERADLRARVRAAVERVADEPAALSADSLAKVGDVRVATGDEHGGIELLCRALAGDAENRDALASLARIFLARRDWARAANCKHRLARLVGDAQQKRALFLEAAEIWEKRACVPHRAARVLEETSPDATVLHRLVALWSALGEWEKLVDALRSLGDLERDPARRAKHLYAMAGVVRDKIGDPHRAAQLYEETLDHDDSRLDAFERIVRIWTDLRQWSELELAYRRMIGRVYDGREKTLEHALYHQLGLVYRDRLGDLPRALDALRRASRLAPNDDGDRRIVVELLVLSDQVDVAIGEMRRTVESDPLRASTYRELYDLFLRDGATDQAWCAANVLAHLGRADETQARFLRDFAPVPLDRVPGTLAACAWNTHVMHPEIDARLTSIFRWFVPAVVRSRMARVPEKDRIRWLGTQVRAADSPLAERVVQLVRDGAEILGVPVPMLLARPLLAAPFAVAPTPTPALFVSLPAAEAVPRDVLGFMLGRRLAELRPELVAHALFPTVTELRTLLKTALRVAMATPIAPPRDKDEAAIARCFESFEVLGLREAVSAIVGTEAQADVTRWMQRADLSVSRAALVLAGDVDVAWRAMQCEARAPGDLAPSEWRKQMLPFAVSETFADLRAAIAVDVPSR